MKRTKGRRGVLRFVSGYVLFFLLVAFAVTCCMLLFLNILSSELGVELTGENIGIAAKWTFMNVMLLTLIFTVADIVRRKLTVDRPVKRIVKATEQIMQGDFSVRLPTRRHWYEDSTFSEIAAHINKMAQELSSIETLRSDFIANVSHELKTPLAVIRNYSQMLEHPTLSASERADYILTISEASQNLSRLITNILRLNKLENQQIPPEFVRYDLSEQICECLLGFEETWERKKLVIETDIEEGVFVRSDAEMMTLVWNNLFSNAMKFTDEGGTVKVTLRSEDEDVLVSVADSGCGISPEVGARIFEKFYQADTSRSHEGNGLGLTLVKRVIDITNGEITVESTPGRGSVFTVRMRRDV